jgi:hypothetical protein
MLQIRDSIHGAKACSLADFTYRSAVKFKCGGPGEHLDNGFTVHNVILVCYNMLLCLSFILHFILRGILDWRTLIFRSKKKNLLR